MTRALCLELEVSELGFAGQDVCKKTLDVWNTKSSVDMKSQRRVLCCIRVLSFEGERSANGRTCAKQKAIDHFELGEERMDVHRRSKDT